MENDIVFTAWDGFCFLSWLAGGRNPQRFMSSLWQNLESRLAESPEEPYTFVVMGDSRDNDDVFIKCLLTAARYHPLFILHTGDAVSTGSEKQFLHFRALLRKTLPDMPVFVAAGNHELTNRDKSEMGKVLFKQLIGPSGPYPGSSPNQSQIYCTG